MAIKRFEAELLPKIRKLDVYARQSVLSEVIEGNWTALFKGHGMEFSGYRAYTYGDDASLIDWKASLRSKSLLVKEYEQEKSVNVYFLFDVSNSMGESGDIKFAKNCFNHLMKYGKPDSQDEYFLITFDHKVKITEDFTKNRDDIAYA